MMVHAPTDVFHGVGRVLDTRGGGGRRRGVGRWRVAAHTDVVLEDTRHLGRYLVAVVEVDGLRMSLGLDLSLTLSMG